MESLKKKVADPKVQQAVLEDSLRVLDQEVAKKSGIGGLAIKGAYKLLKNAQQGKALRKIMNVLMPEFIDKLNPYYLRYQKEGKGTSWCDFLHPHYDTIADELLSVTDGKSTQSDSATAKKTYKKLRPKARKEVIASLPALARMMEKYID